jgi:heme/copper-type cytochrome/quinol oxidase subunit 2
LIQYQPINYLFDIFQYILLPIYSFIRLIVSSFDVIHTIGFYSLGIKIDAIPGKINSTTTLRLLIKGEYRGKCFELCGQGHLLMMSSTIVFLSFSFIDLEYLIKKNEDLYFITL